ncbi:hypothetical protein BCV72DRAFT_225729 [Rhizopus microsporus var. microsporus]|nr:hypothetical protein BCV72DRAFT_225729 [Rhizopus microsporus var. microsporus]
MTDDMTLPVKKLKTLSSSIQNDLAAEVTPVQIHTNRRLKNLNESLKQLQEEKMNRKEFNEWKQKLWSIVREIKNLPETIRDPTDYDHFIKELNKLWDKAKYFHQPQKVRAQIADEVVRKLLGLLSVKEEKEKRKSLDNLINNALSYCLQDAIDDYMSTQVDGWHRLERLVWGDNNSYAESCVCDADVKILKAIRENRHRQKKDSQIQIDEERVDKILDEVNNIMIPAYTRGELFCKEHLEKLNAQFDHINDILQNHSEILKVLANPDDKDLQSTSNSNVPLSTISYSDESPCLSTALATWVKQYTKEYVSGLQEQIDNLQRQMNNVPSRS